MNMIDALRNRISAIRRKTAASAASPYWKTIEDLAAGREPKVRDQELDESMTSLGKTETDLARDAELLAELRATEVAVGGAAKARDEASAMGKRATELDRDAEQLLSTARQNRAEAERLRQLASATRSGIDNAERTLAQLRNQLAERGHVACAEHVAAANERIDRQNATDRVESQLAVARTDLAAVDQALRADVEASARAETIELRTAARDRRAERVRQLEAELANVSKSAASAT